MKPKRRLTQIFFFMLSGVALASILLIGALWISVETTRSEKESEKIRQSYISGQEDSISLETNRICDYIETQRQASEIKFMKDLRERVYEAWSMVEALVLEYSDSMDEGQLKNLVLACLRSITFDGGQGRYYVSTLQGEELLTPDERKYEDLLLKSPVAGGNYHAPATFKEVMASLSVVKEGFYRYNLGDGAGEGGGDLSGPRISYLKLFEPYRWVIGTGEHLDRFERGIQNELLAWAGTVPMPSDNYLMIMTYDGDLLVYPDSSRVGSNIFVDGALPEFQREAAKIIRGAKNRTKDFATYSITTPGVGDEPGRTTYFRAYFRAVPGWRWVVVTWVYLKDLEYALAEEQTQLAANMRSQIYHIVMISAVMLALIMLLSRVVSSLATRSFSSFSMFFERAATASIEMNPDDQPFEEFARLAVAANGMINHRKLAEKLLRESELKFKTIFDVSPQVITISDLEGHLLDANEEYNKFSTVPLTRALGRPLAETFVAGGAQQHAFWNELRSAGVILGREMEARRLNGEPLTLLAFGKTIHLGASSFVLAIFADITALKAAENEKLVLQEKLARSKKMEAMGLMAAEVAHDLNNILSGIIGYPQLLLMEPNITDKQKAALNEILETGQKAAAVVSDLLTIARGVASIKESLPVNKMVTDYVSSPECKQIEELFPKVKLVLDLDEKAGNIVGSPVHLTKIVMNLVSNAFEAMPAARDDCEVRISTARVRLKAEDVPIYQREDVAEGDYVRLRVSDNGPGIPQEDMDKIFEPFYSKKEKGRSGTGLGLAIVWNTVQDHGAYVDVASSPAGTSFTLYFKATDEAAAVRKTRGSLDEFKGDGQRILVVDDVDIQRKLASKMLKTLGYDPVAVPSGEAAVEFLRKEDVDLVILDMIMHPGMNGRETYAAIMEFKPGQRAIIASGMAETEDVAQAQALGAGQFVNKPYTIEDIAVAVKKALA